MEKIEKILKTRLSAILPGLAAHKKMAPISRLGSIGFCPPEARQSAVLVLIVPDPERNSFDIPLMIRTNDGFAHSGQISFPGGSFEEQDLTYSATALREAWEECGIIPEKCRIAGKLSNIYIPPSNYYVHPYVAFYDGEVDYSVTNKEVDRLIAVSLNELEGLKTEVDMSVMGKTEKVPCFVKDNNIIWGATAMILNELLFIASDLLP